MIITWHGLGAITLAEGEIELDINPHAEKEPKMPKISPDVLLLGRKDMSTEAVKNTPFIIDRSGEFEVKDVFVYGIDGNVNEEKVTTFVVEMGGIIVGYLGGVRQEELTPRQLEKFEGNDILIIPIDGKEGLSAKQAVKIINQVEPRIIVPIGYQPKELDAFLKEYGGKSENMEKLKVTKKDLVASETKVTVISPS